MKRGFDLNTWKLLYDVFDFIPLYKPHKVKQHRDGSYEIAGGCGLCPECSQKSEILTVQQGGGKFFCRKYQRGGGPLEAFALSEGIMTCQQLGRGQFSKEQWRQIFDAWDAQKEKENR